MNKEELQHYINPETFNDMVFARLKDEFSWITKENLDPEILFDIENDNDNYNYVIWRVNENGPRKKIYSESYVLEEKDGEFALVHRFISRFGDLIESQLEFDIFCKILCRYQRMYLLKDDRAKFPFGLDINVYIEKAVKKLKVKFPWITKDDLDPDYRYDIEKVCETNEYLEYYNLSDGTEKRRVMSDYFGMCVESFIRDFESTHERYVMQANKIIAECSIPTSGTSDPGGWRLESYVIQKRKKGGYTLSVQGGDSNTGGGSTVVIPSSCFEADNFDEFLDRYIEAVPSFGMSRESLYNCQELRKFLEYK